jgi:hypothetical protein
MRVVIWFLAICSITVHGLSIPVGKVGWHLPRTLSMSLSLTEDKRDGQAGPGPVRSRGRIINPQPRTRTEDPEAQTLQIGQSRIAPSAQEEQDSESSGFPSEPARPVHFLSSGENTPQSAESPPAPRHRRMTAIEEGDKTELGEMREKLEM